MFEYIKSHLLTVLLIPLCVLFVGSSYVRFVVLDDYLVSYEVPCDPATQSCFIGCEDDGCESTYPYYWMEKSANELEAACGESVEGCDAAATCLATDRACTATMCDPLQEECYTDEGVSANTIEV